MPKPKTDENTAAAHDFLTDASSKIQKHADVMKRRIEELTDERDSGLAAAADRYAALEKSFGEYKGRKEAEVLDLKTKLDKALETLRKVQATLA